MRNRPVSFVVFLGMCLILILTFQNCGNVRLMGNADSASQAIDITLPPPTLPPDETVTTTTIITSTTLPTITIPGSGTAGGGPTGPMPVDNQYGLEVNEPPQPAGCASVVNWQNNKVNGVLTRDSRWNIFYSNSLMDIGVAPLNGLAANSFFALRLKPQRSLLGGGILMEIWGQISRPQIPYRAVQATFSECVGDFGVAYNEPSLILARRPLYSSNSSPVGACGSAIYGTDHDGAAVGIQTKTQQEYDAYVTAHPESRQGVGPCILVEGKTYYLNIIQAKREDVNDSICNKYQKVAGAGGPEFMTQAEGNLLLQRSGTGNYVFRDNSSTTVYIPPSPSGKCYFWYSGPLNYH